MILQVKLGMMTFVDTRADLCVHVSSGGLECPLKKGKMTFKKDVKLPKEIPPVSRLVS